MQVFVNWCRWQGLFFSFFFSCCMLRTWLYLCTWHSPSLGNCSRLTLEMALLIAMSSDQAVQKKIIYIYTYIYIYINSLPTLLGVCQPRVNLNLGSSTRGLGV